MDSGPSTLRWKPDWLPARAALKSWWDRQGLAVHVTAPKDPPWDDIPEPGPRADPLAVWNDPSYRADLSIYQMSRTFYGGAAFPAFDTDIGGPGSLGLFLGAAGHLAPATVWYEPVIHDPEHHPPLRFRPAGEDWARHVSVLQEGLRRWDGRYVVGFPDLIENLDTLAQLRESQALLVDLVERPEWVHHKLREINAAYFDCYAELWELLRDPWDGSAWTAFGLWAPGQVAKVQCDFSCMIGPAMFREFVVPPLSEQCDRLDYTMYHLDGTQAIQHLPALLEIAGLDAIEWTPQAGLPGGGSRQWYNLYRRIRSAGKSVQAVGLAVHEVEPLIDAVGPEGLFILCRAETETEARALLRRLGWKAEA